MAGHRSRRAAPIAPGALACRSPGTGLGCQRQARRPNDLPRSAFLREVRLTTPASRLRQRALQGLWLGALGLLILLTFLPVVLGQRTLAFRDVDRLYAPLRGPVEDALRAWHLPLWNPWEGAGVPLLAEGLHGVLHPLSLLAAWLAPGRIDVLLLGALNGAAAGTFVLARLLRASQPAAFGAAAAFALCGFSVSMTGNLVFLLGLSTLPWLVAGLLAAGQDRRHGVLCAALACAASVFAGDAQTTLLGALLGIGLAWQAAGWRGVRRASLGLGLGALLGSVQLAATARHLLLTYRGVALAPGDAQEWALAPWRTLEWLIPGLFRGDLHTDAAPVYQALGNPGRFPLPFAESVFLGAPVLLAAAFGIQRGASRVLLLAGAAVAWAAFGPHLGAQQLLGHLPLWGQFRYAEKLMASLSLCLCLLAALGLDRLTQRDLRWQARLASGLLAGVLLAALLWVGTAAAAPLFADLGLPASAAQALRDALQRGLPHAAAGALAFCALAWLPPRAMLPALAILLAVQAAVATPFARHFGAPLAHAGLPAQAFQAEAPGPRLEHPYLHDVLPPAGQDAQDWQTLVNRAMAAPAFNVAANVSDIDLYSGFYPLRHENLYRSLGDGRWRAYRRFAVTHVVLQTPRTPQQSALAREATEQGQLIRTVADESFAVWSVPHRPWAFFASAADSADHPAKARDRLLQLLHDPDDRHVVLETDKPPPCAPGQVLAVQRLPESLTVQAQSSGPGVLVVNDAFWPGWTARIDGREVPILAADVLVRAVRWPAGRHTLEMRYQPPEVAWGSAASLLGALLCLLLLAVTLRRPRRAPDCTPDTRRH